jgi:hypothetical protein
MNPGRSEHDRAELYSNYEQLVATSLEISSEVQDHQEIHELVDPGINQHVVSDVHWSAQNSLSASLSKEPVCCLCLNPAAHHRALSRANFRDSFYT